jgi:elongation factor P
MSLSDQFRKGMVIRHQGELFVVVDFNVAQSGKQKPTVHVKLRSLKSGHVGERTADQLGKIEEVPAETRQMQYLYSSGQERIFMDTESFEQYPLGKDVLGDGIPLLVEQEMYRFLVVEDRVVAMQLPPSLVMEIAETAPVEHAGGGSTVYKEAKLASGLVIKVPLFIKTGDKVRVSTDKREYLGKEH